MLKIKSTLLISLFVLVVIFLPLQNAILFDRILSQTDTRVQAKDWLENNVLPGSKIIINSWEFNMTRNHECIYDQQQTNNMSLRTRDYVLWDKEYPNSYCVWPLDLVLQLPANYQDYEYYVTDDYTIYSAQRPVLDEELMPYATLIAEFDGLELSVIQNHADIFINDKLKNNRIGPNVKIYKLDFNLEDN